MKFSASTTDLLNKLLIANGAIGSKAMIPLLEDFHFTLKGNSLTIKATDLETSITTSVEVDGEVDGTTAIPARILVDTLKTLPEQPIILEVDQDTSLVSLTSQTGKYKLSSHDAEEYPTLPVIDNDNDFEIDSSILKNAVIKTSFATSNDELRLAMTGIYFTLEGTDITFVSTDAHKLVKYTYKSETDLKTDNFIVPKKSLLLLKNALPEVTPVTVSYNNSHVFFKFGETILGSRLIDSKFPNYSAVIPDNNPIKVLVDRLQLLSALKRISIYANKSTNQVILNINQNAIVIETQDIDFSNEAKETLGCDYDQDPITIGFNAKFLIEMLNVLDTDEVILNLSTPKRAGLILPSTQADDEDLLMLVMPVVLNR